MEHDSFSIVPVCVERAVRTLILWVDRTPCSRKANPVPALVNPRKQGEGNYVKG
jgi:hypothetical protein